uniref:RCC1-like domain-containing protein n=1 Tax=Oryzias melastigma TaxID=30732 RepID=A0A3B3DM69_ORYME
MLAAGSNTSAALTASGKLFMWGDNSEGQIGLGKESQASSPQEVGVGRPIRWVSCGYYHSAFVTVDGSLYTFGERDSGKLGLGTEQLSGHRLPQRVKSIKEAVSQVACGGGHTVALTDDGVFTFGLGQFGQLGHGTFIFESRLPRLVEHFRKGRVCQVACGENHTAVITDGGLLYTFGDGRHGKLALGEENFTNQFKPTLCPRFLDCNVQAVSCGGCHMVVFARPRGPGRADVTLEDDDVTLDLLEQPYADMLVDANGSATLQRKLSARVRRRERERSPDHLGAMFRTMPATTAGTLLPSLPVSSQTIPPRLPPPELRHRKVLNGREDASQQEQTGGEEGDAVESMTDTDSVKGLGDTTDFLNMTHVMKMDPGDKTLFLAPLLKDTAETPSKNEDEDEEEEEESEDDDAGEEEKETPAEPQSNHSEEAEPEEMEKEGTLGEEGPAEPPGSSSEAKANEDPKPANGEPDSNPKIQTGANKKLSLLWRFSSSKQISAEGADKSVHGSRGPRSGACILL